MWLNYHPDRRLPSPGERSGDSFVRFSNKLEPGLCRLKSSISKCMRTISHCIWLLLELPNMMGGPLLHSQHVRRLLIQPLLHIQTLLVRNAAMPENVGVSFCCHPYVIRVGTTFVRKETMCFLPQTCDALARVAKRDLPPRIVLFPSLTATRFQPPSAL